MGESAQRVVVDEVNMRGLFRFPMILRAVAMAFQPPRLIIGLFMVAALLTAGRVWDYYTEPVFEPGELASSGTFESRDAFEGAAAHVTASFGLALEGVWSLSLPLIAAALGDLCLGLPAAMWENAKAFTIVYGLFFVLVIALGGGALSRMAAIDAARQERPTLREGMDFAVRNWLRLAATLILPLLIALAIGAVIAVLGLVLKVPVLNVLAGILYGGLLLLGFLIAFLLVGYALGALLLIPAVACENCDPADAVQRSFAYVISRPLHLLGYALVALFGLALGFVVAGLFAALMWNLTGAAVDVWPGEAMVGDAPFAMGEAAAVTPGEDAPWHQRWTAAALNFWHSLLRYLVVAWVFAYVFSAATIVYLLLRRAADGQAIEEIWRPGLVEGTAALAPDEVVAARDEAAEAAAR